MYHLILSLVDNVINFNIQLDEFRKLNMFFINRELLIFFLLSTIDFINIPGKVHTFYQG